MKKILVWLFPACNDIEKDTTENHNITHTRQTKTDTQINTYIHTVQYLHCNC